MEKVIQIFKSAVSNPSPIGSTILKPIGSRVTVLISWTQRNLERKSVVTCQSTHLVDLSTKEVLSLSSNDITSEQLYKYSASFKLKSFFKDVPNDVPGKPAKKFLEVWKQNKLVLAIDVASRDIHGDIATDGEFGCFDWSPCETKILYTAEKKRPKSESFICPKPQSSKSEDPSKALPGAEYEYIEEWGEQLVGRSSPVFIVCDINSGELKTIEGLPEGYSFGQGLWSPDGGVVGVAWANEPRRLGLIFCLNRPSWIFYLSPDNTFNKISSDGKAVRSPQLSPDGSKLVWLERDAGGPHHGCHKLMLCDWKSKKVSTVVDIVRDVVKTSCGENFYGLYCTSIKDCWLDDNKTLIISTPQRASVKTYSINSETHEIIEIGFGGAEESCSTFVLTSYQNLVVAAASSLTTSPGVYIASLNPGSKPDWIPIVPHEIIFPNYHTEILRLQAETEDPVAEFSAIYLGPKEPCQAPLVVWAHGGPHTCITNSYNANANFFAKLGFAMVLPNYRGSTGAGENSVNYLPGRAGRADVDDVHQSCKTVLEKFASHVNPEKIILWGGSHGGFLVLHLAGQFPDAYKCCIALNPVTDFALFSCVSDIPDWAFVESGSRYSPDFNVSEENFKKMKESSPVHYLSQVKIPVLFLIGKKDLRVPSHNGMFFYNALKARNVETKALIYDDNHSLSQLPHEIDFFINSALWFIDHIDHSV